VPKISFDRILIDQDAAAEMTPRINNEADIRVASFFIE
jgi:hypothetical protein